MAQAGVGVAEEEASRRALTAAMDRHADGDESAFGEVYDALAPRLLAYFSRHSRAHAEDLVQQTLLNMHRARAHFVRGADVVPWAFAIGRRLLIDARRRARPAGDFAPIEVLEAHPESAAMPDEVVATQQLADRLRTELDRLTEPQRAAFSLVREEGLSMAQAAEVLGTTEGAVKLRAHRASEALREVLREGELTVTSGSKSR